MEQYRSGIRVSHVVRKPRRSYATRTVQSWRLWIHICNKSRMWRSTSPQIENTTTEVRAYSNAAKQTLNGTY